MEILKIFKFDDYKKFLTLIIIFSNASMKESKRINKAGPSKWLQSKDPWKSEWIWYFN